jgi:hypothetical protein
MNHSIVVVSFGLRFTQTAKICSPLFPQVASPAFVIPLTRPPTRGTAGLLMDSA